MSDSVEKSPDLAGLDELVTGHCQSESSCRRQSVEESASSHDHSYTSDTASQENGPTNLEGLTEIEAPPPDENPDERQWYRRESLEDERRRVETEFSRRRLEHNGTERKSNKADSLISLFYMGTWLTFFSFLGTLARLGATWLGTFPNVPVLSGEVWANFGGCLALGFLQEDRALFARDRRKLRTRLDDEKANEATYTSSEEEKARNLWEKELQKRQESSQHLAAKKTLPLYIGLSVGFCGSFTSFSSFMRDTFLALSDTLYPAQIMSASRSPGWSVCAMMSVLLVHISLSMLGLSLGAHLAECMMPLLARLPHLPDKHELINRTGIVLGLGCWLIAIGLAASLPDEFWQNITLALVFAPLGAMLRFTLALKLNPRVASFPLGTFAANMFATAVLAAAYDLSRAGNEAGSHTARFGVVSCQVLLGIEDGFCGCLSTVSTWIAELMSLRKRHAYTYGLASVFLGLSLMIVIIGPLLWQNYLVSPICA